MPCGSIHTPRYGFHSSGFCIRSFSVVFTFMGHSGYTEYNDLLMMSTDKSEKVVSLMTDLFYTLVENINGKEYVTLCTVNKANPRNLFQFNIDLNKFGSTYNKGVVNGVSEEAWDGCYCCF